MSRRDIYLDLSQYFSNIPVLSCREDLNNYIKEGKFLGKGVYGNVNLETVVQGKHQGITVVLKKSKYTTISDVVNEVYLLSMCNIFVLNNVSPSFPLTYRYGLCTRNVNDKYFYFLQETMARTMDKVLISGVDLLKSVVVQGVMAVAALIEYMNIAHGDLKPDNLMVKIIPRSVYKYKYHGREFVVDNATVLFALVDFGIAHYIGIHPYQRTVQPEFDKIMSGDGGHTAYVKISEYSEDILTLLKSIWSRTNDRLSNEKQYIRAWGEEIIRNPYKSGTEFINGVLSKLPFFSDANLQSTETYTIDFNLLIKGAINNQLTSIVTALDSSKVSTMIIQQYTRNVTNLESLEAAKRYIANDFPTLLSNPYFLSIESKYQPLPSIKVFSFDENNIRYGKNTDYKGLCQGLKSGSPLFIFICTQESSSGRYIFGEGSLFHHQLLCDKCTGAEYSMLVSNEVRPNYTISKIARPRNARTTVLAHKSILSNSGVPECTVITRNVLDTDKVHAENKVLRFSGISHSYKSSVLSKVSTGKLNFAVINCDLEKDGKERAQELVETLEEFNLKSLADNNFNIVVCCKMSRSILWLIPEFFKTRENKEIWGKMVMNPILGTMVPTVPQLWCRDADCDNIFYYSPSGKFIKTEQQDTPAYGQYSGILANFEVRDGL